MAWVQHHPQGRTDGGRGQVAAELRAHNARRTMRTHDLSPHNPELGAITLGLSLVDVCYALAHVELSLLGRLHALQLHESRVRVLVDLRPALLAYERRARLLSIDQT